MSDIKLFKLNSGEEIIANQLAVTDTSTTVEDAVSLVYQQVDEGRMSIGFAPFMPQAEGEISIWHTAVACVANPKETLLAEYNRVFSKIQIAPASALGSLQR